MNSLLDRVTFGNPRREDWKSMIFFSKTEMKKWKKIQRIMKCIETECSTIFNNLYGFTGVFLHCSDGSAGKRERVRWIFFLFHSCVHAYLFSSSFHIFSEGVWVCDREREECVILNMRVCVLPMPTNVFCSFLLRCIYVKMWYVVSSTVLGCDMVEDGLTAYVASHCSTVRYTIEWCVSVQRNWIESVEVYGCQYSAVKSWMLFG